MIKSNNSTENKDTRSHLPFGAQPKFFESKRRKKGKNNNNVNYLPKNSRPYRTPNDSIWEDVIDFENGSNFKIYLKDKDYYIIGHFRNIEENGNDSWLAVSGFGKFDKETNLLCENEPSFLDDSDVKYVVRISDVEHIEIF